MVIWSHVLGQNIMVAGAYGRGDLFTPWQTGSRDRQEGVRDKILLTTYTQ
jgi:hypothetical protein